MSFHIYTHLFIYFLHTLSPNLTKPYIPTPYTPIPSINIPFLTTISLTFSILKTPKLISELNHLLLFHLLSSLFHNHKTFHFFSTNSNPSRINTPLSFHFLFLFFPFSSLIFYIFLHFLSIANNMPKTRASSSKRPHIEESPQEEEENLSKTYKAKFLILSHAEGTKLTIIRFREILGYKYIPNSLLNNVGMCRWRGLAHAQVYCDRDTV